MVTRLTLNKIVDTRTQYNLYIKDISLSIEKLKQDYNFLAKKKAKLYNTLRNYLSYIKLYYNKEYNEISSITNINELNINKDVEEKPLINMYIKNVIEINKKQNIFKNQLENLANKKLSYTTYKKIVDKCNTKVMDAILYEDYFFSPSKLFGAIAVVESISKTKKVNWKESNAKKERLIEKGLTPYYYKDKEQAKVEGREYNGVEWLVYFPLKNYFFHHFISSTAKKFMPIVREYSFIPARSSRYKSPVKKLAEIKKDLLKASMMYSRKLREL